MYALKWNAFCSSWSPKITSTIQQGEEKKFEPGDSICSKHLLTHSQLNPKKKWTKRQPKSFLLPSVYIRNIKKWALTKAKKWVKWREMNGVNYKSIPWSWCPPPLSTRPLHKGQLEAVDDEVRLSNAIQAGCSCNQNLKKGIGYTELLCVEAFMNRRTFKKNKYTRKHYAKRSIHGTN